MTRLKHLIGSARLLIGGFARSHVPSVWRALGLVYWRSLARLPTFEPPLFSQLRRVGRDGRSPVPAVGRRVLFFSTRQERDQVTITTILGRALELRGHRVVAMHCDRVLFESCNSGVFPALTAGRCESCYLFARRVRELGGEETVWLSTYVTADDWTFAHDTIDRLDPSEYRAVRVDGLPIGQLVRHSVANFLHTDLISADPDSLDAYRRWLVGAIVMIRACGRLLEAERPDVIVMLNGFFMPERICLELARRCGIEVVTYEIGPSAESAVFDRNRPIDYDLSAEWERRRTMPLTADQQKRIDTNIAGRRKGATFVVNYFPDVDENVRHIVGSVGLDVDRRIAVLFTNLTWDAAVFERDIGFDGLEAWVIHTIEWFAARPDYQLVIRVHPAEVRLENADRDAIRERIRQRIPTLPRNVSLVDADSPISSYRLFELADVTLVYTSTIGLEAALSGKPVVVAGAVHYRSRGFTHDPTTTAQYDEELENLLADPQPLTADEIQTARRYAYFFLFEAARPLHFLRYSRAAHVPELRIDSIEELQPGRDADLSRICEAIVGHGSFIPD